MSKEYEFELYQDGIMVAGGSGTVLADVRREALHYASVYAQDGPVKLKGNFEFEVLFPGKEGDGG